ncbi:hypothetical protein ATSB10_05570 [Dyella thiooxydans]|uniref:Uncharacterized protein n=1 Tax=Dyella thiooxydans TaxID=445710 RepID=A0A160MXL0_9GAMM|nr:hypothetical protein ATSB10_05570 [Dyella thiooxydans]
MMASPSRAAPPAIIISGVTGGVRRKKIGQPVCLKRSFAGKMPRRPPDRGRSAAG